MGGSGGTRGMGKKKKQKKANPRAAAGGAKGMDRGTNKKKVLERPPQASGGSVRWWAQTLDGERQKKNDVAGRPFP